MRHGWACDIADFAKYGLLKRLAGPDLRLGVVWYLTNHAASKPPLVSYLSRPDRYRPRDPALFDVLRLIHSTKGDAATLDDIESGGVLPANVSYYGTPLATTTLAREDRLAARNRWFQEALERTAPCDLVFLDPDTGLLPSNRKPENKGGEEYATIAEVLTVCALGQSVVSVQFGAPGNFEPDKSTIAGRRLAALSAVLTANGLPEPFGIWWRDRHKVGMLIAPTIAHATVLRSRTEAIFADRAWAERVVPL